MQIFRRVKNILVSPGKEWRVIDCEKSRPWAVFTHYVLPLVFIASVSVFLKVLIYASDLTFYYFWIALLRFISITAGFYVSFYIVDLLAPYFHSQMNRTKSAQLVAYANTPVYLAIILSFIPGIGLVITAVAYVHSVYLFYTGLGILMRTPARQKLFYMFVAFFVMTGVTSVIRAVAGYVFTNL